VQQECGYQPLDQRSLRGIFHNGYILLVLSGLNGQQPAVWMNDPRAPDDNLFGDLPIVLHDKPPSSIDGLDAPAWQWLLPWGSCRPFDLDDASNVALTSGEITHHHGKVAVFAT